MFDAGAPDLNTNFPVAASWDGKFLAYSTRDEDLHDLSVVVDVQHGKVAHPKFPNMALSALLALSPDGTSVAYTIPRGLGFVATTADAGAQEMAGPWGSKTSSLAWSPNGKWLLAIVESAAAPHAKDLWVIDAATHDAHRIAVPEPKPDPDGDEHERVLAATFSPDGTSVAVLSDVEGVCGHPKIWAGCECDSSLYRASVTGTDWQRMSTAVQGCGSIFWVR
jgi:WD40 repeat protein